uniref:Uncharacterized protein n=1 Tax=Leviviridae sp. TaxID=2027243 RepID=A0A514D0S1_9VIRU|nr:MAG: hypothetical protein H2RhizoLitter491002_000003 [Leviviridae sp.]
MSLPFGFTRSVGPYRSYSLRGGNVSLVTKQLGGNPRRKAVQCTVDHTGIFPLPYGKRSRFAAWLTPSGARTLTMGLATSRTDWQTNT